MERHARTVNCLNHHHHNPPLLVALTGSVWRPGPAVLSFHVEVCAWTADGKPIHRDRGGGHLPRSLPRMGGSKKRLCPSFHRMESQIRFTGRFFAARQSSLVSSDMGQDRDLSSCYQQTDGEPDKILSICQRLTGDGRVKNTFGQESGPNTRGLLGVLGADHMRSEGWWAGQVRLSPARQSNVVQVQTLPPCAAVRCEPSFSDVLRMRFYLSDFICLELSRQVYTMSEPPPDDIAKLVKVGWKMVRSSRVCTSRSRRSLRTCNNTQSLKHLAIEIMSLKRCAVAQEEMRDPKSTSQMSCAEETRLFF